MVQKIVPKDNALKEADAEKKLREALVKFKTATDRHSALIAMVSRIGVSEPEKRLAQAEGKKVDRDMRDAKRLLRDVRALLSKK
jgi:hypothetical protein